MLVSTIVISIYAFLLFLTGMAFIKYGKETDKKPRGRGIAEPRPAESDGRP